MIERSPWVWFTPQETDLLRYVQILEQSETTFQKEHLQSALFVTSDLEQQNRSIARGGTLARAPTPPPRPPQAGVDEEDRWCPWFAVNWSPEAAKQI